MTLTVRNTPVYVLASIAQRINVRNAPVYVLASLRLALKKGGTAKNQLEEKIREAALEDLGSTELSFSQVLASDEHPDQNTSFVATVVGSDIAEGETTFYYNRRPLMDLLIGVNLPKVTVIGLTNTHQLLEQLVTLTGVALEGIDIANQALVVTDNQVTLTAGAGSYFFTPGSQVSIPTT